LIRNRGPNTVAPVLRTTDLLRQQMGLGTSGDET